MRLRNRGCATAASRPPPAGLSRLGRPVMTAAVRHANRKDLGKLRRILEAG